jgi:hypothetical protein
MFISNILPYVRYGYIYIYTLYIYIFMPIRSQFPMFRCASPLSILGLFSQCYSWQNRFLFSLLKKGFMEQNCQLYFFALSSDSFSFLHVQCMVRNKHTCLNLFTTLPKPERTPYVNNLGIYIDQGNMFT